MKNHSTFQRLASLLTVIEIAEPIVWQFEASQSVKEIYEWVADREDTNDIFLITKDGLVEGFLEYSSDFAEGILLKTAEEMMTPIEPWRIVAAETSIFDLIPLWPHSYYFFVLEGTKISHFVSQHHMDSQVVKATLFSLTAELEERMLRLLLKNRDKLGERFSRLTTQTQKKAQKMSERKKLPDSPVAHIQNTYFSEKVKMILESEDLLASLPFENFDEADRFFQRISDLRNELAHGGSLLNVIRSMRDLQGIVVETERVLQCLPATDRYNK